jgi:hypothetical protein
VVLNKTEMQVLKKTCSDMITAWMRVHFSENQNLMLVLGQKICNLISIFEMVHCDYYNILELYVKVAQRSHNKGEKIACVTSQNGNLCAKFSKRKFGTKTGVRNTNACATLSCIP